MKQTFALMFLLFVIGAVGSAQRIYIVSGNLSFLKDEKIVAIEYDYSQMGVGKFATEQEYLDKKKYEYNKKDPGRGDQWVQDWKNDRASRFQPKFEELLNKYTQNVGILFGAGTSNTPVIMTVKTTFTEPGYNIYISRAPAKINLELIFKKDRTELARITLVGAPGTVYGGYDFDTGVRIAEAYAKAGKELGRYLVKQVKR